MGTKKVQPTSAVENKVETAPVEVKIEKTNDNDMSPLFACVDKTNGYIVRSTVSLQRTRALRYAQQRKNYTVMKVGELPLAPIQHSTTDNRRGQRRKVA